MSIFNRSATAVKEPSAAPSPQAGAPEGQPDQPGRLTPPFAPQAPAQRGGAPGVVPPPAAPVYSMRPPESTQRDAMAANSAAESAHRAKAAQHVAARAVPRPAPYAPSAPTMQKCFDRVAATQAGLLKLAWKWQEAGAPIRAIHTYIELLTRYPNTPGADAAVADLVELSDILTEQGQFHTALAIYDHLEALLA